MAAKVRPLTKHLSLTCNTMLPARVKTATTTPATVLKELTSSNLTATRDGNIHIQDSTAPIQRKRVSTSSNGHSGSLASSPANSQLSKSNSHHSSQIWSSLTSNSTEYQSWLMTKARMSLSTGNCSTLKPIQHSGLIPMDWRCRRES
jgi:hypothetical protein